MENVDLARYGQATEILPLRLRPFARRLPASQQRVAEELRLRIGQPMSVLLPQGELLLSTAPEARVQTGDLEQLCQQASDFAYYAAADSLRQGFLTVQGGFRLGVCGTVMMQEGRNAEMKQISSLSLRIAREKPGIAQTLAEELFTGQRLHSTLILSPPGGGKTTLLRDLVRLLSDGLGTHCGLRVGLVDERGELAACHRGVPQLHIGRQTDVLDGCPKAIGIPMLLRAMNPQVIAVDEISTAEDFQAIRQAAGCGVSLLATLHGTDLSELRAKPLYAALLQERIFTRAICLRNPAERVWCVEEVGVC